MHLIQIFNEFFTNSSTSKFDLQMLGIFPLSDYRKKIFYFMCTDALDSGTKLEKRLTKAEISSMIIKSGLSKIKFINSTPFWVAIGYKNRIF